MPTSKGVTVRLDDLGIDEVIAVNAHVHLERMSDQSYCLIVETQTERVIINVGSRNDRSFVDATESDRSPVNRRSEAAKRAHSRRAGQAREASR